MHKLCLKALLINKTKKLTHEIKKNKITKVAKVSLYNLYKLAAQNAA